MTALPISYYTNRANQNTAPAPAAQPAQPAPAAQPQPAQPTPAAQPAQPAPVAQPAPASRARGRLRDALLLAAGVGVVGAGLFISKGCDAKVSTQQEPQTPPSPPAMVQQPTQIPAQSQAGFYEAPRTVSFGEAYDKAAVWVETRATKSTDALGAVVDAVDAVGTGIGVVEGIHHTKVMQKAQRDMARAKVERQQQKIRESEQRMQLRAERQRASIAEKERKAREQAIEKRRREIQKAQEKHRREAERAAKARRVQAERARRAASRKG